MVKTSNNGDHKPVIETLINTAAIACTTYGVAMITQGGNIDGYGAVLFGMLLEFCKYLGRKKKLW